MSRTLKLPRAPLPRQRGGPHGGARPRELSPREEVTLRLNEMAQEDEPYLDDLDYEELRSMLGEEADDHDDWFDELYGPTRRT